MDGYAASHRAVTKLKTSGILPRRVQVRSCKYLNNVIEQDHRRIKQRVRPMLGFKRFETAAVMIRGIELAEKIKKRQFNLRPLKRKSNHRSGNVGQGLGGLKSAKSFTRQKQEISKRCRISSVLISAIIAGRRTWMDASDAELERRRAT